MQKWAEKITRYRQFLPQSWFPRCWMLLPSLEEGTSSRRGITTGGSFQTQWMPRGLADGGSVAGLALGAGDQHAAALSTGVVAGTAEILNTKKQSGGLKRAAPKRRKKGKEWKGKSCDSKEGNNVLSVVPCSYAFYGKSWACASFQGENTSSSPKTTLCAKNISDLELWPDFVVRKFLFSCLKQFE